VQSPLGQDAADGIGITERALRDALSLAQSKLVPVVGATQKERPRAKLKGPPPAVPSAAHGMSPPLGAQIPGPTCGCHPARGCDIE